jgi:hypothetical protein
VSRAMRMVRPDASCMRLPVSAVGGPERMDCKICAQNQTQAEDCCYAEGSPV